MDINGVSLDVQIYIKKKIGDLFYIKTYFTSILNFAFHLYLLVY